MRKILAAIVEYKLNKNNLNNLVKQITAELRVKDTYPHIFYKKMTELLNELKGLAHQNILSAKDEELVMDALNEMELIIVDYLTLIPSTRS
jgi:hypothetical protein